jgi:hypothetical protein
VKAATVIAIPVPAPSIQWSPVNTLPGAPTPTFISPAHRSPVLPAHERSAPYPALPQPALPPAPVTSVSTSELLEQSSARSPGHTFAGGLAVEPTDAAVASLQSRRMRFATLVGSEQYSASLIARPG